MDSLHKGMALARIFDATGAGPATPSFEVDSIAFLASNP